MEKKKKPESLMMSYGYKPELSEGAIKSPIFQTSTFAFKTAEDGRAFFEMAYGHRKARQGEEMGLIYSRINNPNLEILEGRIALWDNAEDCAVFESGMSAITTVMLEFLRPGKLILYSSPCYGGTNHFIKQVLPEFGIHSVEFNDNDSKEDIIKMVEKSGHGGDLALIYVETPANPTNALIDLKMCKEISDYFKSETCKPVIAVDNTFLGPLWQHPLQHGADLVVYSATKYIGGHSDIIAGACCGNNELMGRIRAMRTFLGNMAGPWIAWLMMRSLETLKVRMEAQQANAEKVAEFLNNHQKIEKVYYLGNLNENSGEQYAIFKRQCLGKGSMLSFDVKGGLKGSYAFLNNLKMIKLAVSLGSTESLAEHPGTMTHIDVDQEEKIRLGVTDKLVRLSVGLENYEDIIEDLEQALEFV